MKADAHHLKKHVGNVMIGKRTDLERELKNIRKELDYANKCNTDLAKENIKFKLDAKIKKQKEEKMVNDMAKMHTMNDPCEDCEKFGTDCLDDDMADCEANINYVDQRNKEESRENNS